MKIFIITAVVVLGVCQLIDYIERNQWKKKIERLKSMIKIGSVFSIKEHTEFNSGDPEDELDIIVTEISLDGNKIKYYKRKDPSKIKIFSVSELICLGYYLRPDKIKKQ